MAEKSQKEKMTGRGKEGEAVGKRRGRGEKVRGKQGGGRESNPPLFNNNLRSSLVFDVLNASQTLELSIDHDGQSCAQSLTLLHAARRKEGRMRGGREVRRRL